MFEPYLPVIPLVGLALLLVLCLPFARIQKLTRLRLRPTSLVTIEDDHSG